MLHLFFSGVSSFPLYLVAKLHLNHRKASPCVLNFSFFYHPLLPEFFMEALHGVSSNISYLLLVVFNILVGGDQAFIIVHSEVQFFLPYRLRWCYIILGNLHSCFAFHMLSGMRYFKSINLFVGVILCHISPKAFPKECCYSGDYQWSKLSLNHLGGRSFSSHWCYHFYYLFPYWQNFATIVRSFP